MLSVFLNMKKENQMEIACCLQPLEGNLSQHHCYLTHSALLPCFHNHSILSLPSYATYTLLTGPLSCRVQEPTVLVKNGPRMIEILYHSILFYRESSWLLFLECTFFKNVSLHYIRKKPYFLEIYLVCCSTLVNILIFFASGKLYIVIF